jgi:D-alanine-D-alanine ligase
MQNLGIICGGFSSEFDISVKSARNIFKNIPTSYQPYLIFLKSEGWFIEIGNELSRFDERRFTFTKVEGTEAKIDLCLIYIHGDPGENGKVQAYLDLIKMPYVNSNALASELSFDKWYCNQFLRGFGVPVAKSIHLTRIQDLPNSKQVIDELGLPIFVKPCDSGSSYGIAKVKNEEELSDAVQFAFKEGRTVVMEAFLNGTEVTCGVYRRKEGTVALPVTEIVTANDFFDYDAKYNGLSEEITPARINESEYKAVQELAKRVYELLQLRSIARIDFMLVNGVPHVIEVNTTPGFSDASIVPQMLDYAGIKTVDFWSQILEMETTALTK